KDLTSDSVRKPAIGATLRCAMLLSWGTSRQCGIDAPVTVPPGESTTLRSPAALTIISMHSWPTVLGVHSKGPIIALAPGASEAGPGSEAVVIGAQSPGQIRPVIGRLWYPRTVMPVAGMVPRFLMITYAKLVEPTTGSSCVVPPSA